MFKGKILLKLWLLLSLLFGVTLFSCRPVKHGSKTYDDYEYGKNIKVSVKDKKMQGVLKEEEKQYYFLKHERFKKKAYKFGDISLIPSEFKDLNGWNDREYNFLLAKKTFMQLCSFAGSHKNKEFKNQLLNIGSGYNHSVLCAVVESFKHNEEVKFFFEHYFTPFKVYWNEKNTSTGTFTGYYRIELDGSLEYGGKYKYPVYKRPPNLKEGDEYYTRRQIAKGVLYNKDLEIVWLSDIVDAYLLHIQGTGIVKLENGQRIYLSFDGKNGRKYSSVADYAKKKGIMDNLNGLTFYDWIRQNPKEGQKVLNANESFVFFKASDNVSVFGSSGIKLTPEAALAVDSRYIPYGSMLWLNTKPTPYNSKGVRAMFLAADTGADIKGPIRGDIYFGGGKEADEKAHHTKVDGSYYILLPNRSPAMDAILRQN